MRRSPHLVLALFVVTSLLSFLAWRPTAAQQIEESDAAAQAGADALQLALDISSPVNEPGDSFAFSIFIANPSSETKTPTIDIALPAGLTFDLTQLPAGAVVNLQTNGISWYPVLAPTSDVEQITFELTIDAVDLSEPIHSISATLSDEGTTTSYHASFWVGLLPSVSVTASPPEAAVGQPVQLLSTVNGSGPLSYRWDTGDGRILDVANPLIAYPTAGTYTVTLDVTNPLGVVSAQQVVTILPETVAYFTLDDTTPGPNQTVQFINLSGGQPPLTYEWDFGDGATSLEMSPYHQYAEPGDYVVRLAVSNEYGVSESEWTLTVGALPAAGMQIAEVIPAGQIITGQGIGDETVTNFVWDMGDGSTYNTAAINHIYTTPGNYWVSLTAINQYGGSSVGQWIVVGQGQWQTYIPFASTHTGSSNPAAPVVEQLPLSPDATPAEQLLWYINEARRIHGLPPVSYNYELSIAAQQHVADMAIHGFTGHTGSDGSTPPERLLRFGYSGAYAGEATAWGFDGPVPVVEFWVNSPSHRNMILNPNASEIGIGFYVDYNAANVWYWTVEFGIRRPD